MMGAECLNVEGLSSLEDARQKLVASPAVVAAPGELRNRQAQTCPGFASFLKGRASGTSRLLKNYSQSTGEYGTRGHAWS